MDIKFRNDKHYEETVIQALIADHNFAEQMVEVLNVDYFNIEYLKESAKLLFGYWNKYKIFPTYKLIVTLVKNEVKDETLKEQMITFLLRIKKDNLADIEYVKENSLDFCKKQALTRALEASLSLIENKRYEQITNEIQKALQAGAPKNIGHIYEDNFELRMIKEEYKPIATPWPEVNTRIKGGPGGGKLCILAAPSGVGKSHFLVDVRSVCC